MEHWYLPITFLPAIGLLVISCTNLLISLNEEMDRLQEKGDTNTQVFHLKQRQLSRLTKATVFFYLSASFFTLSGLITAIADIMPIDKKIWGMTLMLIGVIALIAALMLLVIFSVKAVNIRKLQHQL